MLDWTGSPIFHGMILDCSSCSCFERLCDDSNKNIWGSMMHYTTPQLHLDGKFLPRDSSYHENDTMLDAVAAKVSGMKN